MNRMSSDTMARHLDQSEWAGIVLRLPHVASVIALVCPLCNALVLETGKAHHIAWHIEGAH